MSESPFNLPTLQPSVPLQVLGVGDGLKEYSPAVDMWSVGVILFILLSGYSPFGGCGGGVGGGGGGVGGGAALEMWRCVWGGGG